MMPARRAVALQRERHAAEQIPYAAHVAESVVRTLSGDYLQAFRLGGASFESADDEQLNNWHERLNVLWRNVASPDLALWTHVIRRRERATLRPAAHAPGFAAALATRYATRLSGETLMVNELYLAVLFRPAAGLAAELVAGVLARTRRRHRPMELNQALESCAKLAQTVQASLARYDPEPLGVYRCGNAWCSTLLEYLAVLVNGEPRRVPLSRGPLNEALATTRLLFGTEAIEYRMPAATRSVQCSVSRSTRLRASSECSTACCRRPSRSSSRTPSPSSRRRRGRRCCSGSSTVWRTRGTLRSCGPWGS